MWSEETIAAVATAYGEGGIGIIRMSGDEAKNIFDQIFVPAKGAGIQNRKLAYGVIKDPHQDEMIDEVLAVFFKSPNTYTREDIVEINCHGSIVALRKILDLVLKLGARLAEPGEFTKRAFLNGRIDLTQAEAVIDLIKAKTEKSFDSAFDQLEGKVSLKVSEIRTSLMELLVKITVNLDYPDEDIEEITYAELSSSASQISDMIEKLLATADTGRIIRDGLKVVISGSPNVGKSSLLNALLKENRAIVTEIPGTTRDTIEESMSIRGIPIKLVDTAGIRNTEDVIEQIGIEKSKQAFNDADLILFMVDGSEEISNEELTLLGFAETKKAIVLINKIDLDKKVHERQILDVLPNADIIRTSVISDIGINELEEKIEAMVYGGQVKQSESLLITNARHKDLLSRANKAIEDAKAMVEKKEALDFIEVDVKLCWELLGEIIGETATDDIINEIFANFCLGK
ncbi:MAG: tRNA uridine-5-carboxymethylaminomethyl(34) synthesis GTPase MnmE, partial [Clostridiales bacterium]|nr:tRNA uridine-5-carboxymethylaminomethyl(34) synthesis GTPase MnmE [Clostridiales bacterium]